MYPDVGSIFTDAELCARSSEAPGELKGEDCQVIVLGIPKPYFFGTMNLPSQDFLLVNCRSACLKYTSVNLLVLYPKHLRAWNPLSLHRGYTNSWIVKPLIFRLKRSDLEMKHSEISCAKVP